MQGLWGEVEGRFSTGLAVVGRGIGRISAGAGGHQVSQQRLPDDYFSIEPLDDDEIRCMLCGTPFNDGEGLYCSAECEELANPSDGYF